MRSFILFSVGELKYAIDLEKVHRIVTVPKLTKKESDDGMVDGIITFEGDVIEVASFRSLVGLVKYDEIIKSMFVELKKQHRAWLDALEDSVHKEVPFSKTTDPHACHLGKWIDSFNSYDDSVLQTLKNLNTHHKNLHHSAIDVLEKYAVDKDSAREWVDTHVNEIYTHTIAYLDEMAGAYEQIANDSQKLLVLTDNDTKFGVKVDNIEGIVHVDDSAIKSDAHLQNKSRYLEIVGVLEHEKELSSIVGTINL